MANPWWVGVDSPNTTVEAQAPTKAIFAHQNFCTVDNVYGPFTQAQADAFNPPAFKPPHGTGSGTSGGGWFVGAEAKAGSTTTTPFVQQFASKADYVKRYGGDPLAGPFATKAQAQAWINSHKGEFGADTTGGLPSPGSDSILPGTPGLTNPLSGIDAIGHFFGMLGQRGFIVRVMKVVIGSVLIFVGVMQLSGASGKLERLASNIKVIPV